MGKELSHAYMERLEQLKALPELAEGIRKQNQLHDEKLPHIFCVGAPNQYYFRIEDLRIPPPREWRR